MLVVSQTLDFIKQCPPTYKQIKSLLTFKWQLISKTFMRLFDLEYSIVKTLLKDATVIDVVIKLLCNRPIAYNCFVILSLVVKLKAFGSLYNF